MDAEKLVSIHKALSQQSALPFLITHCALVLECGAGARARGRVLSVYALPGGDRDGAGGGASAELAPLPAV
ncbi:hypothetical protein EVAR_59244_1 [Eumeta japonica]|uniref:Uncharacterized protein n=1 Tax=Eumeta variegata TaxID=151549 RepID=A0A4C2A558_EUMVA|nr:hypothetical protein EVAR_59244_1 [Eumeta japonica]